MTKDECWLEIETFTLNGDWNGLLVCADALQELGEEEMAGTIRWAQRKNLLPDKCRDSARWWIRTMYASEYCTSCLHAWTWLHKGRTLALRYYS